MNMERIRHGGVVLCFAAACGLLFLVAGDSGWAEPFGLAGIVATLAGLAYVATGLTGTEDADETPRGGRD